MVGPPKSRGASDGVIAETRPGQRVATAPLQAPGLGPGPSHPHARRTGYNASP